MERFFQVRWHKIYVDPETQIATTDKGVELDLKIAYPLEAQREDVIGTINLHTSYEDAYEANPNDREAHGRRIFTNKYVPPELQEPHK